MNFDLKRYETAVADYHDKWEGVQQVLCDLCRRYPDHRNKKGVYAKLLIIGRSYATGIERQFENRTGHRGRAMELLGAYFWKHGGDFDEIIQSIAKVKEPLDADSVGKILSAHHRLMELVAGAVTHGRKPVARSFASKYLHFHNPAVPIYDRYAAKAARAHHFPRNTPSPNFAQPGDCDLKYSAFVRRLCLIADDARKVARGSKMRIRVKLLDKYLLAAAEDRL